MASWIDLWQELDRWRDEGRVATLWWRDDDAEDDNAAVQRLLEFAEGAQTPVHLAVVPAKETGTFTAQAKRCPLAWILQHGFGHVNHAPSGQGCWELGLHRPKDVVLEEIVMGSERLRAAHGEKFLPVLVPPWNRIAGEMLAELPMIGFRVLSRFSARRACNPVAGMVEINTHCDPLKWKDGIRFAGIEAALDDLLGHLAARRNCRVDPDEPTGLLTHHRNMNEAAWNFVETLLERTSTHPGARWITIKSQL